MEDYGEPWVISDGDVVGDRNLNFVVHHNWGDYLFDLEKMKRAVTCVNAMAGIEDPVKFIAEVREAQVHISKIKKDLQKELNELTDVRRVLAKISRSMLIVSKKT